MRISDWGSDVCSSDLEGQKSFAGKLIAIDTERDLALVEITEGRLPAAAIYTGPLESGADVVALGYPGNVDLATARSANDYITPRTPTRSEGNMSNLQTVDGVAMLIHPAKIPRGNSGGDRKRVGEGKSGVI